MGWRWVFSLLCSDFSYTVTLHDFRESHMSAVSGLWKGALCLQDGVGERLRKEEGKGTLLFPLCSV